MSRKIIGITVGTQLPKPNFKQTDPTKGDYIKNKPDFEGLKSKVDYVSELVGDTPVDEKISVAIDTKFDKKADLVDGKVPLEQLPDNIGGEVDWETNVINKPFYDARIRSYYSQVENPNPPQIDNVMMNMSCYKVSDLIPTRTEIFNSTKLIINGQEYTLDESGIQLETDDFIYVSENKMMFSFIFVNKSGTLNFTVSGYPMSIEVPKAGIYYQRALNAGVPAGRTIEFIIGELKQIDPKFIPADLDFNLDDYYTKVEADGRYYGKSEVYNKNDTNNVITTSLQNYYTKNQVDNALNNVSVDLSGYYTKDETYSKSEVDNVLNNIDLSNYYTKTETDSIIGDIDTVLDEISALIGE